MMWIAKEEGDDIEISSNILILDDPSLNDEYANTLALAYSSTTGNRDYSAGRVGEKEGARNTKN